MVLSPQSVGTLDCGDGRQDRAESQEQAGRRDPAGRAGPARGRQEGWARRPAPDAASALSRRLAIGAEVPDLGDRDRPCDHRLLHPEPAAAETGRCSTGSTIPSRRCSRSTFSRAALASHHVKPGCGSPTILVDFFILVTLLAPHWLANLGFLRILRLWTLSQTGLVWRPLRAAGLAPGRSRSGRWSTSLTFLFVVTGFVYTFFVRAGDGGIEGYVDALYFTVATVTTTGFGDITLPGTCGQADLHRHDDRRHLAVRAARPGDLPARTRSLPLPAMRACSATTPTPSTARPAGRS